MNNQMNSPNSASLECQQEFFNEAFYRDIHARFLHQSARYLELDTVAIEGNLIPSKASAN